MFNSCLVQIFKHRHISSSCGAEWKAHFTHHLFIPFVLSVKQRGLKSASLWLYSPCFWGWRSACWSRGSRCYPSSPRSPPASPRTRPSGRTATSWYRTANRRRDPPSSNWARSTVCTRLRLEGRRWAGTLRRTPRQTWRTSPCLEPAWHLFPFLYAKWETALFFFLLWVSGRLYVSLAVWETLWCLYRLRLYRDRRRSSNQSWGGWMMSRLYSGGGKDQSQSIRWLGGDMRQVCACVRACDVEYEGVGDVWGCQTFSDACKSETGYQGVEQDRHWRRLSKLKHVQMFF